MAARNMAPWIGDSLRSVRAQTLKNWECLIVDDGSDDATAELARAFNDPGIRVLQQTRRGVSAARNRGLAEARGKYVAFLDADDIWIPQALEILSAPLESSAGVVLAWAEFLRFDDTTRRLLPSPATRLWMTGDAWLDMLVDNCMQFGAIMARAGCVKSALFDESLQIGEDRDWLLRVLKGAATCRINAVVHYYRQRAGSAVRDAERFLANEAAMMGRHLADPDVPKHIRQRALASLDFHAATLLAKIPGRRYEAVRRYVSAVRRAPLYCENHLRVLRKVWFTLNPVVKKLPLL
jgi:glycosyltransferase involved in cell wall biosynthesis